MVKLLRTLPLYTNIVGVVEGDKRLCELRLQGRPLLPPNLSYIIHQYAGPAPKGACSKCAHSMKRILTQFRVCFVPPPPSTRSEASL